MMVGFSFFFRIIRNNLTAQNISSTYLNSEKLTLPYERCSMKRG